MLYTGIIVCSLLILFVFSFFAPVKNWITSVKSLPFVSLLLILLFVSLFLTVDTSARVAVTEIDTYRFLRIILLVGLTVIAWFGILLRHTKVKSPSVAVASMFVFSIYAMSSYFYSNNPFLSLWKGFEVFAAVSVFLLIYSYLRSLKDIENFLNVIWLILLFLVITALVGGIFEPRMAFIRQLGGMGGEHAYEYMGIFPPIYANTLAQYGATLGMVGLVSVLYNKNVGTLLPQMLIGVSGLTAMFFAHSRTSMLGLLLAAVMIFIVGKRKFVGVLLGTIAVVILSLPGLFSFMEAYVVRGQTHDAFVTLSGRTNFWPLVLEAFYLSPIFGHGYYAGHRDLNVNAFLTLEYSSVDNTYLEVLVDLGLVGMTIFIFALLGAAWSVYKCRPSLIRTNVAGEWQPTWLLMGGLLLIIFVRSLTGPTFQVLHPNLLLFLSIAVAAAAGIRTIRSMARADATK